MDHFADRLASIRSGIAARNESDHILQLQHVYLPQTLAKSAPAPAKALPRAEDSFENLKLPLLQLVAANNERAAPPSNSYLSIEAIRHRSELQAQFKTDAERLAEVEQAAAAALQNADRLSEESRIAMVMYSQNERSWSFDERATRYQKVMEAKLQAENARVEAEEQKKVVQRLRSELVNPYSALLSSRFPCPRVKRSTHLSSRTVTPEPALDIPSEDYVRVWILAAPSTNLGFTPRATSNATILGAEKELSTHVVYYAAASMANEDKHSPQLSDDDRAKLLVDDCPPQSGWISCFNFGVALAPQVTSTKSSIETWVVSGAGIRHLNGKYILNGIHDNVRKFKSSAGIELFRKRVPVSSSLAQGLHDAPNNKSRRREISSPDTSESVRPEDDGESEAHSVASSTPLPSALKAIENDETNFSSMSKIGSWLGANEVREKYRRRREAQGREREDDGAGMMVQDTKGREDTNSDIQVSRSEASAELCREWVLFLGCSRRQEKPKDGTSVPPKQKIGLGCLKRHYYISVEEKETMTIWAQDVEAALEKNVLQSIIRREAALDRVHHLCNKCVSKFQQNLSRDAEKVARKILVELNIVRFLSVRVFEAIDKWRAHARKLGFARVDVRNGSGDVATKSKQDSKAGSSQGMNSSSTEAPLLGWSASITISTGRQLYKRSNAFASKIKRFCRAEDVIGKKEQHIVYLGYFATKMEAERAYEEFAAAEARRLNTTVAHLPRHRNVFRSCGKHFAVESECFGPSVCIECKVKQLATLSSGAVADEWAPPFFYLPGENYILKMANDLDFLDEVLPLKSLLNDGHGSDEPVFPILGNVFLLPKTPIQDPSLAVFTTCGLAQAPRLGVALATEKDNHEINDETLDRDRILAVQMIFLQELQMYLPHLFPEGTSIQSRVRKDLRKGCSASKQQDDEGEIDSASQEYRIVEALYWDRCAALRIQQQRMPLPFRQPNVWCRPDAGEWSSLLVRGKNQLHFLFEMKLALAGKETQEKRRQILKALRKLQKTPLYWIPSREHFTTLIADGYGIKGRRCSSRSENVAKYLENTISGAAKRLSFSGGIAVSMVDAKRKLGRRRSSLRAV
uniref:Uncharacterized protein n=1 Tax=Globisporangium ultimum (strain ATCC 200006 / CBS 805.95 / DAOM BR144) TaxID=431595 RepID=K3WU95_GLOUD